MLLYIKETFPIGRALERIPDEPEHRSFVLTLDGMRVTVSFVTIETMQALGQAEVSKELHDKLASGDVDIDSWTPALADERRVFVIVPRMAFFKVYEVIKYVLKSYDLPESVIPKDLMWGTDGQSWQPFPVKLQYTTGIGYGPSSLDVAGHGQVQQFLTNNRCVFLDAFRHLHRSQKEREPRFAWIDATTAAELAIKEFLITFKPELATLLLEVPSPPIHKLYGSVLESFTGHRSPKVKELQKGAATRNKLLHRPNETVSWKDNNTYFMDVETAIYHLLTLLYPKDELIQKLYWDCTHRIRFFELNSPQKKAPSKKGKSEGA